MSKKLVSLLLSIFSFITFCIPSHAASDNVNSVTVRHINCDSLESSLAQYGISKTALALSPRATTCCDAMRVVWIKTDEWHTYTEPGSYCLGVLHIGYRGCSNCGAVWDSTEVVYRQDGGCGEFHT